MSNPASKEDSYRAHAAQLVDLASRAATTSDKGRLLAIAEAWLDLADRVRRIARRRPLQPVSAEKPSANQFSTE
jgi:hypothetical protein